MFVTRFWASTNCTVTVAVSSLNWPRHTMLLRHISIPASGQEQLHRWRRLVEVIHERKCKIGRRDVAPLNPLREA